MTTLAFAEPFIASDAAVAFIRCFVLFFKGSHGLVVPPRHGHFFAKEKGLAPAAMSGKINITPISILNLNQNKKEESLSFEGQKKQKHLPEFQKNIL